MNKFHKDDPKVAFMTEDQGPFKCGNCEYFRIGDVCTKVEGIIHAEDCCNLYSKANFIKNLLRDFLW